MLMKNWLLFFLKTIIILYEIIPLGHCHILIQLYIAIYLIVPYFEWRGHYSRNDKVIPIFLWKTVLAADCVTNQSINHRIS
jgi:hypothetical protein